MSGKPGGNAKQQFLTDLAVVGERAQKNRDTSDQLLRTMMEMQRNMRKLSTELEAAEARARATRSAYDEMVKQ